MDITVREKINRIAETISNNKDHNHYFDTLDRIITGCCDCMGLGVKMGYAPSQELKERYAAVIDNLVSDIKIINDFCDARGLPHITELSPEEFVEDLVREFFETRRK